MLLCLIVGEERALRMYLAFMEYTIGSLIILHQCVTPNIYVGVARQYPENGDSKLVGFLIQNSKSSGPSNSTGAGMEPMDGHGGVWPIQLHQGDENRSSLIRQNVPDLWSAF